MGNDDRKERNMIKITIVECTRDRKKWGPTIHRTNDKNCAIERAISKHWSKKHSFFANNELNTNPDSTLYGQIGHWYGPANAYSMDTRRVRIDIEVV